MLLSPRWSTGAVLAAVSLLPSALAAQIPGDRLPTYDRVNAEHRAEALRGVSQTLAAWSAAWRADSSRLAPLYAGDAVLLAPHGDSPVATARAATVRLEELRTEYAWAELGISDFVAEGDLAFVFGTFEMRGDGNGSGMETLRGVHVTLLERGRGRRNWRIRSQVFRAGTAEREAEPPL